MSEFKPRRFGPLKALEKLAEQPSDHWIILLHGYGASQEDLASLADLVTLNKNYNWLFPNAPLEVPIAPGFSGRAWWPLDLIELEEMIRTGGEKNYSLKTPKGLEQAAQMVNQGILELKVPWNQIILGGFSQGAMLATEVFLNQGGAAQALVVLSGTVLNQDRWQSLAAKSQAKPFFMSHGKSDSVLPVRQAEALETLFCQAGLKGRLELFEGGHEIPAPILAKLSRFINSL